MTQHSRRAKQALVDGIVAAIKSGDAQAAKQLDHLLRALERAEGEL